MSFNYSTKWSASRPVAKQFIYLSVENHQSIPPSTHRSVTLKPNEIKCRLVAYHQSMTCAESVARNLGTHIYIYLTLCLLLPLKWQRPSKTIKEWSPENKPLHMWLTWAELYQTHPTELRPLGRFGLGFDGSSGRFSVFRKGTRLGMKQPKKRCFVLNFPHAAWATERLFMI